MLFCFSSNCDKMFSTPSAWPPRLLVNRALAGTGFQGSPHAARVCHMANRIQQYRIDFLALCGHKICKPSVQKLARNDSTALHAGAANQPLIPDPAPETSTLRDPADRQIAFLWRNRIRDILSSASCTCKCVVIPCAALGPSLHTSDLPKLTNQPRFEMVCEKSI
jgi:hypothetical protein